jgi:hypothetical protein
MRPRKRIRPLINRDKVIGEVQGVRDGKLLVKAAQTSLERPMQRVSQLVLGRTTSRRADRVPGNPGSCRGRRHGCF